MNDTLGIQDSRIKIHVNRNEANDSLHRIITQKGCNYDRIIELLHSGMDPNIKNENGDTALHVAVSELEPPYQVIHELILKGATVNAKNAHGSTPLHLAISNFNMTLANQLCVAGASFTSVDNEGDTPLHLAVRNSLCTSKAMKDILKHDVCVDTRNKEGRTALIEAVLTCKATSIVKALLKKGADVSLVDDQGHSALHYAISCTNLNTARLLFSYGAHPCKHTLRCCFADEPTIRLMILYLAVKHVECNRASPAQNLVSIKDVISLHSTFYVGESTLVELCRACFLELSQMKCDYIYRAFTMDMFLLKRLYANKYQYKVPSNATVNFIGKLTSGLYKNYRDLILFNFNRRELLRCLSSPSQIVYYTLTDGKVISLNGEMLQDVGKHLPKEDLIKIIMVTLKLEE